jgi:hypothetical protein
MRTLHGTFGGIGARWSPHWLRMPATRSSIE